MEMMSMTTGAIPLWSGSAARSKVGLSGSWSWFCCSPNSMVLKKAGTLSVSSPRLSRRNKPLTCNALFGLGVPELVVIAGVAALVFGPKKLPEVGRSIGKTVKSFQQAAKEFESEIKKEPEPLGGEPSEKAIAVGEQQEEEKQGTEVSSSKENV